MNLKLKSVNVPICKFFWWDVVDVSVLQRCDAVSLDIWVLPCQENYIVSKC